MMKFYGRNNCKIPLDMVVGKNEKVVLEVLSNLSEEITNRLFLLLYLGRQPKRK